MINGPVQEIYIFISSASSEGSEESRYMRRLTSAVPAHLQVILI